MASSPSSRGSSTGDTSASLADVASLASAVEEDPESPSEQPRLRAKLTVNRMIHRRRIRNSRTLNVATVPQSHHRDHPVVGRWLETVRRR